MADRPDYNRAAWDRAFDLGFDAYTPALAITEQRILEKRLYRKRPACKLTLPINAKIHVEIRPILASSATGWIVGKIEAVLVERGLIELKGDLTADRTLRLRRWWKNDDRNEVAFEELQTALMRFADSPRQAMTHRASNCGWCGRALSDPASMEIGVGPECRHSFELAIREAESQMENARPADTGPSAKQNDLFADEYSIREGVGYA